MQLKLNSWRCFEQTKIELPPESIIICDANGSGKTSLLSAVYSLLTANPWPQTKFLNALQAGKEYFGIEVESSGSQWFLNGKINPSGRLSTKYESPDFLEPKLWDGVDTNKLKLQDLTVLTYLPTDNSWLFESRTTKLRILDEMLSQVYGTAYRSTLKKLGQSALQKQSLIRHSKLNEVPIDYTLLRTLSNHIQESSTQLWQFRLQFFAYLNKNLPAFENWIESKVSGWQVKWEITEQNGRRKFVDNWEIESKEPHWETIWQQEIASEKILYGAQRDDFNLVSKHLNAQDVFSRGEMRSLVLFIKNLSRELAPQTKTVWLMDDIFNELDNQRERTIFEKILRNADWFLASSTQKIDNLPTPHLSVTSLTRPVQSSISKQT